MEPTEFDSKAFLEKIDSLKTTLEPAVSCEENLPLQDMIKTMVAGRTTISSFKLFSVYSQQQLNELREHLDAVVRCIDKEPKVIRGISGSVSGGTASGFDGLSSDEKLELLEKLKQEIASLSEFCIDAELAALSAALVARKVEQQRLETERKTNEETRRRQEEEAGNKAQQIKEQEEREEEERKRKEEEERKAKEEEERKAKEEEERKAKEEEERKAKEEAERKAKEEAERKAKEEEKQKAIEEDERKAKEEAERKAKAKEDSMDSAEMRRKRLEAERRATEEEKVRQMADGSNWPAYKQDATPGKVDQGIICLVWNDDPEFTPDKVKCHAVPQMITTISLAKNQQILSSIVELKPTHPDYKLEKTIYVAIPFYAPRPPIGREAVMIAETSEGTWERIDTKEVTFSLYKNMRFAQAEVAQLTNLAVVSVPKRDCLRLSKRGGKFASTLDNRITFSVESNMSGQDESIIIEIQPVEASDVSNLKKDKNAHNDLLACSSMMNIEWESDALTNPVTVTIPCPPSTNKTTSKSAEPARKTDKKTGSKNTAKEGNVGNGDQQKSAQKLSMGQYGDDSKDTEDDDSEVLFLLRKTSKNGWRVLPVDIQQPKFDMAQFQLDQPVNSLVVLRTKPTVTATEAATLAKAVEEQLNQKRVTMIVRQSDSDPCDISLHVVQPTDVDNTTEKLRNDRYSDGPAASPFFMLTEGDEIEVDFRGNIRSNGQTKNLRGIYNSPVCTSVNFSIDVSNKYMQEKYQMYQGFVQLYKKKMSVEKTVKGNDGKSTSAIIKEIKREFLCEVLIQIPKVVDLATQPPATAPIKVVSRADGLNEDLLRHLADKLDDDVGGLVKQLGLSKMSVNKAKKKVMIAEGNDDDIKYELLLSWIKQRPHGESQVKTVQQVLEKIGHRDLADQLVTLIETYRH